MGKNHTKRISAPRTWDTDRKATKFVTKQSPWQHPKMLSYPINVLLKEIIGYAATTRESKKLLNLNEVKIDGKRRRDFRFPVGIFDTIQFSDTGKNFRVMINNKGKLGLVEIGKEEASMK